MRIFKNIQKKFKRSKLSLNSKFAKYWLLFYQVEWTLLIQSWNNCFVKKSFLFRKLFSVSHSGLYLSQDYLCIVCCIFYSFSLFFCKTKKRLDKAEMKHEEGKQLFFCRFLLLLLLLLINCQKVSISYRILPIFSIFPFCIRYRTQNCTHSYSHLFVVSKKKRLLN